DLTLRSPGEGVVTELAVKPKDHVAAGASLIRVATMNPMAVDLDVPPAIASAMRPGELVVVRLADSGREYPGAIRTIAPLPGKTGGHAVEVVFDNPKEELLS